MFRADFETRFLQVDSACLELEFQTLFQAALES